MKIFDNNRAETFVVALGGLGEVGKNMYAIMHDYYQKFSFIFIISFHLFNN